MKKLISILLTLVLLLTLASCSLAEEAATVEGSKFEQLALKKGSFVKKEYISGGTYTNIYNPATVEYISAQTAILTDMVSGDKFYALRLEHSAMDQKFNISKTTSVLDVDEVDSVIATLNTLKAELSGNLEDYTEYVYQSNSGLSIGGYHSSDDMLFIRFNSSDIVYSEFSDIDALIDFFVKAKEHINSYQ